MTITLANFFRHSTVGLCPPPNWMLVLRVFALVTSMYYLLVPGFAFADAIVTTREVAELVRLEEVDESNGEIFGFVANHSERYIYRVNLLIRYHWHWRDEFRPGEDDESWHEDVTLTELIPPNGKLRFTHRSKRSLPEREDGELLPTVSIESVQAYEKRGISGPPAARQIDVRPLHTQPLDPQPKTAGPMNGPPATARPLTPAELPSAQPLPESQPGVTAP